MVPSERVRLMDPWVECLDDLMNSVTPLRLGRDSGSGAWSPPGFAAERKGVDAAFSVALSRSW